MKVTSPPGPSGAGMEAHRPRPQSRPASGLSQPGAVPPPGGPPFKRGWDLLGEAPDTGALQTAKRPRTAQLPSTSPAMAAHPPMPMQDLALGHPRPTPDAAEHPEEGLLPTHTVPLDAVGARAVDTPTGQTGTGGGQTHLPMEIQLEILRHIADPYTVLAASSVSTAWHDELSNRRQLALFEIPLLYGIRPPSVVPKGPRVLAIQARRQVDEAMSLKYEQGPAHWLGVPMKVPQTLCGLPEEVRGAALGAVTRAGLRLPLNEFRPIRRSLILRSDTVKKLTGQENPLYGALVRSGDPQALRPEDRQVVDGFLASADCSRLSPKLQADTQKALTTAGRYLDRVAPEGLPSTLEALRTATPDQVSRLTEAYLKFMPRSGRVSTQMICFALQALQALRPEDQRVVDGFLASPDCRRLSPTRQTLARTTLTAAGWFLGRVQPKGLPATLEGLRTGTRHEMNRLIQAYLDLMPAPGGREPEDGMRFVLQAFQAWRPAPR